MSRLSRGAGSAAPARWHERLRELWQFRRVENLTRDVSYSVRVLRKSPGFTFVAILTLALGVGANTTVFSVINGLLLRPLPVPESNQLVVIGTTDFGPRINYSLSEPLFRGLEHRHQVFSEVFAFNHATMQVKGNHGNENVQGQLVSGDFFSALETPPLLGRTLTRADDVKGGNPAGFGVVISESFWQRWFSRAPYVVGAKLEIDNTLFTVVGVMPKRFIGADPLEASGPVRSDSGRTGNARHAQHDRGRFSRLVAYHHGAHEARNDTRPGQCRCRGQQQRGPSRSHT